MNVKYTLRGYLVYETKFGGHYEFHPKDALPAGDFLKHRPQHEVLYVAEPAFVHKPLRGDYSLCWSWPGGEYSTISIFQHNKGARLFEVRYGKSVDPHLTYADACKELGAAILHRLCCEGQASNEGK